MSAIDENFPTIWSAEKEGISAVDLDVRDGQSGHIEIWLEDVELATGFDVTREDLIKLRDLLNRTLPQDPSPLNVHLAASYHGDINCQRCHHNPCLCPAVERYLATTQQFRDQMEELEAKAATPVTQEVREGYQGHLESLTFPDLEGE